MITGFPSPAQGYEGKQIDFNSYMIKHPSATVVMRIENSHYTHMGIYNGDLIVIDRAKKLNQSSLVVYESYVFYRVNYVSYGAGDYCFTFDIVDASQNKMSI